MRESATITPKYKNTFAVSYKLDNSYLINSLEFCCPNVTTPKNMA